MQVPPPEPEYGLPTTDTSKRFPADRLLRKAGFSIWSRRENAEPVWRSTRTGKLYAQEDALLVARKAKDTP